MLQPDRVVQTTCPYCGVGCQIDLLVKDELIYRVNGRFDNPVNRGNLCVKGRFGFDFIHAPDRLTAPLVRHDRTQPLDARHETTWDTALDHVAGPAARHPGRPRPGQHRLPRLRQMHQRGKLPCPES
jgi:predicted molibdopterin-dependent oxidoreductase YjgC